ncbi:MAG: hypothetical protein J5525_06205 [Lachnospiraceae bacterium]|nr:hypothetical protein [Lachnospiraceae bacterium]
MRKKISNKKVIRAMAFGMAAMISVSATPVKVFAQSVQDDQTNEVNNTEQTDTVTKESALNDTYDNAQTAETYTGSLKEGSNEASGDIGKLAQSALDDINKAGESIPAATQAQTGFTDRANTVEAYVDEMTKDATPGTPYAYTAQIKGAEEAEKAAETEFGVKLDSNAGVLNRDGLDRKVSNANEMISKADEAKTAANTALGTVSAAVTDASGKVSSAADKKEKADSDSKKAKEAIAGKSTLDANTKETLDSYADTLSNAVNEKSVTDAVTGLSKAGTDAYQITTDNISVADNAFKSAQDAAEDAQNHSASYNRQQMIALAIAAQNAAETAQKASEEAQEAVNAATKKQTELQNSLDELTKAKKDAAVVLNAYKNRLDEINKLVSDANASIGEAKPLLEAANNSINTALTLMNGDSSSNADSARKKVEAMNEAIKNANDAIKAVTGLMYDENDTADKKAQNAFFNAQQKYNDASDNLTSQLDSLNEGGEIYSGVDTNDRPYAGKRNIAQEKIQELDKLINGKEGEYTSKYDTLKEKTEQDIRDIKALALTGKTYSELTAALNEEKNALIQANREFDNSEKNQNLTADQIVEKYNAAVAAVNDLNSKYQDIDEEIDTLQSILVSSEATDQQKENARIALYGENGNDDYPEDGSLCAIRRQIEDNNNLIEALGPNVENITQINNDLNSIETHDFTSDNYVLTATANLNRISAAKQKANGFLTSASDRLNKLDEGIQNAERYKAVKNKIDEARARLNTVNSKLTALDNLQKSAKKQLSATSMDAKVVNADSSVTDLDTLDSTLNTTLSSLANSRVDLKDYSPLGYVYPLNMDGNPGKDPTGSFDELSIDVVSEKLAAAINTVSGLLQSKESTIEDLLDKIKTAKSNASQIEELAKKTKDEADKAARALADWRNPHDSQREDDDDDSGSASNSSSDADTASVSAYTATGNDITLVPLADTGAGVAGSARRLVANNRAADISGVLGVKNKAESKTNNNTDEEFDDTTQEDVISSTDDTQNSKPQEIVKTNENQATIEEKPLDNASGGGSTMAWMIGLAGAAAGGAGAFGYGASSVLRKSKILKEANDLKKHKK